MENKNYGIGGLFKDYQEYLASDIWQEKVAMLKKIQTHCQHCKSEKGLIVHHKTYENLGNEGKKDLIVLCRKCHEKEHKKTSHFYKWLNKNVV